MRDVEFADPKLLTVWAETESALRIALECLRGSGAFGNFGLMETYLDNNENGLAFEALAFDAPSEFVSKDTVFAIQMAIAADRMKLPVEERFGF